MPEPALDPEPEEVAEIVPAEVPIEAEVEEPVEAPKIAVHTQPAKEKKVKRVVVVEHPPEIDWLWYERGPESMGDQSLRTASSEERQDSAADSSLPPDLWWNGSAQEVRLEDRA